MEDWIGVLFFFQLHKFNGFVVVWFFSLGMQATNLIYLCTQDGV
jgi:hypothetical protein